MYLVGLLFHSIQAANSNFPTCDRQVQLRVALLDTKIGWLWTDWASSETFPSRLKLATQLVPCRSLVDTTSFNTKVLIGTLSDVQRPGSPLLVWPFQFKTKP